MDKSELQSVRMDFERAVSSLQLSAREESVRMLHSATKFNDTCDDPALGLVLEYEGAMSPSTLPGFPRGAPVLPFSLRYGGDDKKKGYWMVAPEVVRWDTTERKWVGVEVTGYADVEFKRGDKVYLKLTQEDSGGSDSGKKTLKGEITTTDDDGKCILIADLTEDTGRQYFAGTLVLYGEGATIKGNTEDSVMVSGPIEIVSGADSNVKVKTYYEGTTPKMSIDVYYL